MTATESSKRKPLIIGIAGGTGGKDTYDFKHSHFVVKNVLPITNTRIYTQTTQWLYVLPKLTWILNTKLAKPHLQRVYILHAEEPAGI